MGNWYRMGIVCLFFFVVVVFLVLMFRGFWFWSRWCSWIVKFGMVVYCRLGGRIGVSDGRFGVG